VGIATVLLSISFCQPSLINDDNQFLKEFVSQQLLSTLGIILTVTLASAASLHLELNKIEDETGKPFLRTRQSVRRSAYSLLLIFAAATVLVMVKPLLPTAPVNRAVANAIAVLIVYFNLSVLYDLTRAVFKIPGIKAINAMTDNQSS
jgi:hypothetical protein